MSKVTEGTGGPGPVASDDGFAEVIVDLMRRRFHLRDERGAALLYDVVTSITEGHGCVDLHGVGVPQATLDGLGRLGILGLIESIDATTSAPLTPFVLWRDRMFAQRQFTAELQVAHALVKRSRRRPEARIKVSAGRFADALQPVSSDDTAAGRAASAGNEVSRSVVESRLTVLTGGPGTGKTYTLVRSIAVFVCDFIARHGREPKVAVCAPTGKAAIRADEMLKEFVRKAAGPDGDLVVPSDVLAVLDGIESATIHRLLGRDGRSLTGFRHGADHPIDADLVVVDETSMVPLALMAALLAAIRDEASLLLAGDDAQLESVELGAVLGEVKRAAPALHRIAEREVVFELTKVHRVSGPSDITDLAGLIRRGDEDGVDVFIEQRQEDRAEGVRWVPGSSAVAVPRAVVTQIVELLREAFEAARVVYQSDEAREAAHRNALGTFASTKVLCGPRAGRGGVDAWNDAIARALGVGGRAPIAPGVPVLVQTNAPNLGLVNGSIGLAVAVAGENGSEIRVVFDVGGGLRYLAVDGLPDHERCFAMTVHKSQGSEYAELVVIALPGEDSRLATRELLYTGLTRAKKRAVVVGPKSVVRRCVLNESSRVSAIALMADELA